MLEEMGKLAKCASYQLATLSSSEKNRALLTIADTLEQHFDDILEANSLDTLLAKEAGMSESTLDRLLLTPSRIAAIVNDVRQVCRLGDPIGKIIDGGIMDSGLKLERRRVPLGVIGVIYEARPNVTIDVATLCLKTGNAVILRGGKETVNTNRTLVNILQSALANVGLPAAAIQSIEDPNRAHVAELLKMDRYVDMLIPRGGPALHKFCREHSTIPVITGGIGVCHMFVDQTANLARALTMIENAKAQRPSTCNSVETILVHKAIAGVFLPQLNAKMASCGVTLHASPEALALLGNPPKNAVEINEDEYGREWLSLDVNVTLVDDIDRAIEHIRLHGSSHSDAILTRSIENANYFIHHVDSAAVYVNASTRFTDGAQFGLGAEVAVSTQKLHARGPMGLEALTTYKWIGFGDDLVRQ